MGLNHFYGFVLNKRLLDYYTAIWMNDLKITDYRQETKRK